MSNNKINIEVAGKGPAVVLIHGWGMHAGLFQPIVEKLKDRFRFYLIDLPGHGDSTSTADLSELDHITHLVAQKIHALTRGKVNLLGWSLGGLIAQRMAILYPESVSKLILVSSSACLVGKEDWSFGIDADILDQFSAELETNYQQTLHRFLALQFIGSPQQKNNIKLARELISMKPSPTTIALQQGLDLLKTTDLRNNLSDIGCPVLLLSGERDTLIPTRAIQFMSSQIPLARCFLFRGGSHAPFLTHHVSFNLNLEQFLL